MFTRGNRRLSAQLSICAVLISFLATAILYGLPAIVGADAMPPAGSPGCLNSRRFVGGYRFAAGPFELAMALVVTGVGSLIHIYSAGYMRGDERMAVTSRA